MFLLTCVGVDVDPSAASKKRKPGQDASHFKTDRFGKLVIPDSNFDHEPDANAKAGAGSAFVNATRGVDGAFRDGRGNLRFNKNTKRSRAQEEGMGMDLDEVMGESKKKIKGQGVAVERLGEEFRAKVSNSYTALSRADCRKQRAGGDIKRVGGVDPYAYVPIGQAARKQGQGGGGGRGRVSLTNKKRGSRR